MTFNGVKAFAGIGIIAFLVGGEINAGTVTSIVSLIAKPDAYVDRMVAVVGVIDTNAMRLYLSRDHFKVHDFASSISISDPDPNASMIMAIEGKSCNHKYVQIVGEFKNNDKKALDYGLVKIKRVFNLEDSVECFAQ